MHVHIMRSMNTDRLRSLGFSSYFEKQFSKLQDATLTPARIAIEHKDRYIIYSEHGELTAELAGKLRHEALILPAVGDWVAVRSHGDLAVIHHVLERRTKFSRIAPGTASYEQIVAANIDTVFIVVGLDQNFNLRRTERFLVVAQESGADAVIVLNKSDLAEDLDYALQQIAQIAGNAPVIAVSATTGENIERLRAYTSAEQTVALLGSSGVGKSSLINAIIGEEKQAVSQISESNAKGRHTTTHRELIELPSGGLIIDTPGMRELQVVSSEESLAESFGDIDGLAKECHFSDCSHATEPGCAIQVALAGGALDQLRWRSFQKLQREIRRVEIRNDVHAMLAEKAKWKKIHRDMRDKYKE
jgi:ribosome biogenesis GTPase / thiamine phosphate phosphatase